MACPASRWAPAPRSQPKRKPHSAPKHPDFRIQQLPLTLARSCQLPSPFGGTKPPRRALPKAPTRGFQCRARCRELPAPASLVFPQLCPLCPSPTTAPTASKMQKKLLGLRPHIPTSPLTEPGAPQVLQLLASPAEMRFARAIASKPRWDAAQAANGMSRRD